jgi:ferredoxin
VRVQVDHDVCEANAVCEDLVPEVFFVNDEDVLEIKQPVPPAEFEDGVRQAVLRCPKAALSIVEDD